MRVKFIKLPLNPSPQAKLKESSSPW